MPNTRKVLDKAIKAIDAEVKYLSHVKKAAEALGVDPSTLEDAGMKRGISDIMSKVTGAIVAKYNWSAGKLTLTGRK